MESAPELKELMLQYYEGSARGDADLLAQLIDRSPGTLVVGTDPDEWWEGGDAIVVTWSAAWRERGGLTVVDADPRAYREGSVGWVADRAAFVLPNRKRVPFRLTAVFHQTGKDWTLLQAHFSFGVPNDAPLIMEDD